MKVNYSVNNAGYASDFGELFIPRALFSQGGLWTWGTGPLGTNTTLAQSSPVQTIAGGNNWKMSSVGTSYSSAVKTDGTLWSWGYNNYGQVGNNVINDALSPVQTIAGGSNWYSTECGTYHTVAIKTDGTLWAWGRNDSGQLGTNNITHRSSPVQTIAGGTNWKMVSAFSAATAAVKTDGTLWTWGYNFFGQLGTNNTTDMSSPVQTIAGGTDWKLVNCGDAHTTAIKTNGTLWVWGLNSYGQLGTNDVTRYSSPVQTVAGGTDWKYVSCGSKHTVAIKTNGTLWVWGSNSYGQLGTNDVTRYSSPVQTVAGGTNWKLVSSGNDHTAAIKTDGTLWVWGANGSRLGTNDTINRSSPVQTIAGGTNWKSVASGAYSTIGITNIF